MPRSLRLPIAAGLIFLFLMVSSRPADAQAGGVGFGKGAVVAVVVGVAAVAVVVTVAIHYAFRRPTITGCAVAGANGLTLLNESDHQPFALIGDSSAIKAGDRVRIQGKKEKDSAGNRSFFVSQLKRDYGACPATSP